MAKCPQLPLPARRPRGETTLLVLCKKWSRKYPAGDPWRIEREKEALNCKKILYRTDERSLFLIHALVIIEQPKIAIIFFLQSSSLICNIYKNDVAAGACSRL
jgi:hypothetical protein